MLSPLSLLLAGAACLTGDRAPDPRLASAVPSPAVAVHADSAYRALFESGLGFTDFVERAQQRKEQWQAHFKQAVLPDALLARASHAGGPWRLLVVAVSGCSDSVNSIPYLARLVSRVPGLDLRIVDSNAGRSVMASHRTPDGRAATPTVILLDGEYNERGCWIERPSELQSWIISQKGKVGDGEIFERKMRWYDDDKGAKSLDEIVAVMEAAAAGSVRCGAKS